MMTAVSFDVTAIIHGLAVRLQTISGLRTYETIPGSLDPPAVIFSLDGIQYDVAMDNGADSLTFLATIFVQAASDRGFSQLYAYMAPTGTGSVNAAIDGDQTLGGVVSFSNVVRVRTPGIIDFGGAQFYAAPFEIAVGV